MKVMRGVKKVEDSPFTLNIRLFNHQAGERRSLCEEELQVFL